MDSEFSYFEISFTDPILNTLEIEDKINITLVINESVVYKKWDSIQFNQECTVCLYKVMGFLSFAKNMSENIGKNISKSLVSWK